MTAEEVSAEVARAMCWIRESGADCGEIILVVRGGRVKYVDYRGRLPRVDGAEENDAKVNDC